MLIEYLFGFTVKLGYMLVVSYLNIFHFTLKYYPKKQRIYW